MNSPDVLVVCTANVARSPLLATLLVAQADARVGTGRMAVASAGAETRFGDPVANGWQIVAGRPTLTLDEHRSRPLAAALLRTVGLIVAMTRQHTRAVLSGRPGLATRTFALRKLTATLWTLEDSDAPRDAAPARSRVHRRRGGPRTSSTSEAPAGAPVGSARPDPLGHRHIRPARRGVHVRSRRTGRDPFRRRGIRAGPQRDRTRLRARLTPVRPSPSHATSPFTTPEGAPPWNVPSW